MPTISERIIDRLRKHDGYCDDCLSMALHVKPRQAINQACRETPDRILRELSVCRGPCGNEKIVNHLKVQ